MASKELKELVKKLFYDEQTRIQFEANPDAVLNRFAFSDQEKKAIKRAHEKLGTVAVSSQQLEAAFDPDIFWDAPIPISEP